MNIQQAFDAQTSKQWVIRKTTAEQRIAKLQKLKQAIKDHEKNIKAALHADLNKVGSSAEIEISACYTDLDDTINNLETWMAPVDIPTSEGSAGARAKVVYEARGIVLLFGPWNYPFSLVFQPLIPIIAAGNCAIVKPNEMTPNTSAVTAKIIKACFDADEVAVFEGGVDLANQLLELPVDHIFFTGSPAVGKIIMSAAAKHLASITLELGGKNPVIVDKDANIKDAAQKVAFFRNMNSGQVCLSPENIWVHEDSKDAFIAVASGTFKATAYKDGALNTDVMGKIIDQRNLGRVKGYIDDAVAKGANAVFGGDVIEESLSIHPTILTDVASNAQIQDNEIFGPVLCVFTYKDISEVYSALRSQSKPLALYVFSENEAFIDDVLSNTTSGGVTVNSCMMHFAEHKLPFGGVNGSGIGRYHGIHGFKELSHERSVLYTE